MVRRHLDLVVLSDMHLGSYHCRAQELNTYLSSIKPKTLVLNGDVLERSALRSTSFPKKHMEIINTLLKFTLSGTQIYYVTGNHDDYLRKFLSLSLGSIHLRESLDFQIDGERYWIFHGDVLDAQKFVSPTVRFLGKKGYNLLLQLNRTQNGLRKLFGKSPISLASKLKHKLGKAQSYIDLFERTAAKLAFRNGYDRVICGHIHQPTIKQISVGSHSLTYMNSGDWVENLTALELRFGKWSLYNYHPLDFELENPKLSVTRKKHTLSNNKRVSIPEKFEF